MDIHQLLSKTDYIKASHLKDVIISGISFDSRKTKKNDIFVAIDGADEDGHKYIDNAIQKGVAAIVIT
ncbi:MAG TPA: Mur ligase domain-containing protein, partial [Clostridia bacterium]|nr:Mur ligase domain-containing protein [Clostridia bacterium]